MLSSLTKFLKWRSEDLSRSHKKDHLIFFIILGVFEDVLFWRRKWLSITFIIFINLLFFIGTYQEAKLSVTIICMVVMMVSADGLELWLKQKHRISFLQKIANKDKNQLINVLRTQKKWLQLKWNYFIDLREANHTKAFLMANIVFTAIGIIGKCFNMLTLVYITLMMLSTMYITSPVVMGFMKKLQSTTESDAEIDYLIPEITDKDLRLLSIEDEQPPQECLDTWRPEDVDLQGDDVSDNSESSSSLATNLSIEKLKSIDRDDSSDASGDDEYIPLVQQQDQLQSTLEIQPANSWGNSALSAIYNLTGTMSNLIYSTDNKRQRISSGNSSDGFEIIDQNEL